MPTINVTLPPAKLGVRYNEAITLTGSGPFSLGKYDLPDGLTAEVIGNQLIVNGTVTVDYADYEAVFEIFTGCKTCAATIIVGALASSSGATSCECSPVVIPAFTLPPAVYGEEYYALIPLEGSGPFELCGGSVPYCLKAEIVGRMVRITGQVKIRQTPLEVRFSVKNACTCDCVDYVGSIPVTGQPGCTYCWSMQPTIAVVGAKIISTVDLPDDCPDTAELVLDVFMSDGVTRYMMPGITPPVPLIIRLPKGQSEYTVQESDLNQHLIFKPAAIQNACLASCTPCINQTERLVPDFSVPCGIQWSLREVQFVAGVPKQQVFSATGIPTGCAVQFRLYNGNTLESYGGFELTHDNPTFSPSPYVFPPGAAGQDYNYRPVLPLAGTCLTKTCSIGPARIDFDVFASSCVVQWDVSPSPVLVGSPSSIRVLSGPPNCLISFQAYDEDGVTPIPGVINIQTDSSGVGASAPGVCTSAGTVVWKPVTPQPSTCAQSCSFGTSSFTHTCTGGAGVGSCGMSLVANCLSTVVNSVELVASGLVPGRAYNFQLQYDAQFSNGDLTWYTFAVEVPSGTSYTKQLNAAPSVTSSFRVVDAQTPTCMSNVALNPCGVNTPLNYYCNSGTCGQYATAPSGALGPYTTLALCQSACTPPPGGCSGVTLITPADAGSPTGPCGTSIGTEWKGLAGAAWNKYFNIAPGATVSATGMPVGMTTATVGAAFQLNWAAAVAGSYTIIVTAVKAGCPNCVYTINLVIAAAAGTCAKLSLLVSKGPSAYTPVDTSTFNAADQRLLLLIEGTPNTTVVLTAVGTVNVAVPLTIGPDGTVTSNTAIGQHVNYNTTWTITPGTTGTPAAICPGFATKTITGSTCLSLTVIQNPDSYSLFVTAPPGAIGVPFRLDFGGPFFGGSALCASNSFGTPNDALTTNSAGGGNVLTVPVTGIVAPYSAAIKLSTNAGTSQNTHMVCGPACVQVNYP